jgi:large conductance mechanosensitive channel
MIKGFKDFLLRGNVVDLAVAVVIGVAFGLVISAFTDKVVKPLINAITPASRRLSQSSWILRRRSPA